MVRLITIENITEIISALKAYQIYLFSPEGYKPLTEAEVLSLTLKTALNYLKTQSLKYELKLNKFPKTNPCGNTSLIKNC